MNQNQKVGGDLIGIVFHSRQGALVERAATGPADRFIRRMRWFVEYYMGKLYFEIKKYIDAGHFLSVANDMSGL